MTLKLLRFHNSKDDTLGLLFINEQFACFTLEDEYRAKKVKKETRIPEGTYKIGLRYSPKFTPRYGHEMLHIQNVPDFEFILIHPGNKETDTDGCILVGDGVLFNPDGISSIGSSLAAYRRIYPAIAHAIKRGEEVQIGISMFPIDWVPPFLSVA